MHWEGLRIVVYETRLRAADTIAMEPSEKLTAATNPGASGPRTGAAPNAEMVGEAAGVPEGARCVVIGSTAELASSQEYN